TLDQAEVQVYKRIQLPGQFDIAGELRFLLQQHSAGASYHQVPELFRKRQLFQLKFDRRLAPETEQAQRHAVPELDVVSRVYQHDRQANFFQGLPIQVVDLIQVFTALLQFLVRGLEFFVQRLQFFVRGFKFFVGGLQFLVGGFQLFVGGLQLFVRSL